MATMPSESIDVTRELDAACRWGIRAAWRLSVVWGALVALLAWTAGAQTITAVIRGAVTFLAVGLIGWGVNAVMAHAGARDAAEQLARRVAQSADDAEGERMEEDSDDGEDAVDAAGASEDDEGVLE